MSMQWAAVGLLCLAGALGCSANSPGGNVNTTPEDSGTGGSGGTLQSRCNAACPRIVAAGCGVTAQSCASDCNSLDGKLNEVPAACRVQFTAFLDCTFSQPTYTCTDGGVSPSSACQSQAQAVAACAFSNADGGSQ